MTKIKSYLESLLVIFFFLLGLAFICWVLYNRLRYRDSIDITHEFNNIKLIFYSYLFLLNSCILIFSVYMLLLLSHIIKFSKTSNKKYNWFYQFFQLFSNSFIFIKKALKTVYLYGIKKIPKFDIFRNNCCFFIVDHGTLVMYSIPILIFSVQYIVLFSLLIDVFYFHKFHYFYKTLILLLIPSLINVWCYCIMDYAKEGIALMNDWAEIKVINDEDLLFSYVWNYKKYKYDKTNFEQIMISHRGLCIVVRTLNAGQFLAGLWTWGLILKIVKSLLYCIVWGYLIIGMLPNFI